MTGIEDVDFILRTSRDKASGSEARRTGRIAPEGKMSSGRPVAVPKPGRTGARTSATKRAVRGEQKRRRVFWSSLSVKVDSPSICIVRYDVRFLTGARARRC